MLNYFNPTLLKFYITIASSQVIYLARENLFYYVERSQ